MLYVSAIFVNQRLQSPFGLLNFRRIASLLRVKRDVSELPFPFVALPIPATPTKISYQIDRPYEDARMLQ